MMVMASRRRLGKRVSCNNFQKTTCVWCRIWNQCSWRCCVCGGAGCPVQRSQVTT